MKISHRKSPRPLWIAMVIALVFLLALGGLWVMLQQRKADNAKSTPPNTVNYDAPTPDQVQATTDAQPPLDNNESNSSTSSTAPSQNDSVSLAISSSSISDGQLHIRSIVRTVTSGNCTLTLSRTGVSSVTSGAPLQALSTYSTCQGFDVPIGTLTPGKWTASVTVKTSGGATGSASREVTIE